MTIITLPQQASDARYGQRARIVWDGLLEMSSIHPNNARVTSETDSKNIESADVESAIGGDQEAFGRLVKRHQSTIALQMRRFSQQQGVIEELVHDVFVEAYVSLRSYQSRGPFLHWLRKIAVRKGYAYWKSRKRAEESRVSLSDIELTAKEVLRSDTNASELLADLLAHLPPRDRLVLTLIYWDGCTVSEAADLSGWSESMVKVQAHRARKKLKKLIEEAN